MFESGSKLADAWAGIEDTWRNRDALSRSAAKWSNKKARIINNSAHATARSMRDAPTRTKMKYGAGVVGISSGAYMWHRHQLNNQMYSDPNAPYYY